MLSTKQDTDWADCTKARAEGVAGIVSVQRFGSEPELWARAPGRVDLMGSHTDYNLGFVLTLPISRDTWIAATTPERWHRAHAFDEPRRDRRVPAGYDSGRVVESRVVQLCARRRGDAAGEGLALTGCDAVIHSTVPVEAG